MGGARRRAAIAAAVALAAITTASAQAAVWAQEAGQVTLAVSPSTELIDGQVVTVDGGDYLSNGDARIIQCISGSVSPGSMFDEDGCDHSTTVLASVDAEGVFSSPFAVSSTITVLGSPVDCVVVGACEIVAVNASNQGPPVAAVAIEFAGAVPPTTATTVAPPTTVPPVAVEPAFTG